MLGDPVQHVARLEGERRSTGRISTSSQVTGVDTVGRGRARSEYTATVVLCRLFWLQSMKTLPGRAFLAIVDVTRSPWCFSSTWATACANDEHCSCSCGVFSGT